SQRGDPWSAVAPVRPQMIATVVAVICVRRRPGMRCDTKGGRLPAGGGSDDERSRVTRRGDVAACDRRARSPPGYGAPISWTVAQWKCNGVGGGGTNGSGGGARNDTGPHCASNAGLP